MALSLRGTPQKAEPPVRYHGVARAFFAVALGPTVGTAKSCVIVGINGLETKVWGSREEDVLNTSVTRAFYQKAMATGILQKA